jgi:hypothetical protein
VTEIRPQGLRHRTRPDDGHQRESIEAHVTIVFASPAVSRWIEATTG